MIKLQVIGNLGRDSVLREVNGKSVINFSMAHYERYRDSAGNQRERTTWVDCSYWTEKTGIAPFLKKGVCAYAEGFPGAEAFTSKDGHQGVALRLRVINVQVLGSHSKTDDPLEQTGTNVEGAEDLYRSDISEVLAPPQL